ncbi:galactokinase [Corynebacterium propinquum]|uniref:galactokinase n=1 Tax=Corynebacterium propinquum TaxID=43769 RepID=UPI00191E015F|nr:galactokinase [Corynebacterium propinquum]MCG7231398.1 galactokinase [Corynebacterium propinquum]MDK4252165.1 galactokinase [Corynebacterium propinquum]MDK8535749.1 galactokinase [Corynebacterium propinquum]MDK8666097.1 galactokinase [Corynebacterium propinquum]QQU86133.1 galactokinase [Corynebacterium propinquum]
MVNWFSTRSNEKAIADVTALFREYFAEPAGVWSAPGRVNLIGEHVDYAGGICLPFALSQRTYVAAALNQDGVYRVVSQFGSETMRAEIAMDQVCPGYPDDWAGYVVGTIWAAGLDLPGLDIAIISDVPVGAGLSSSAALECSVALAAADLSAADLAETSTNGKTQPDRTALMQAAIRAENEVVGASTGGLDQRIALFAEPGHALAIDFATDSTQQVPFQIADRGLAVLITNTNAPHSLADGQYASRRAVVDGVTSDLQVTSLRYATDAEAASARWAEANAPDGVDAAAWQDVVGKRVRHIVSEIARTATAIEQLQGGDLAGFGESMQASHASLRDDYEVSVAQLDVSVDVAMEHGALGARMTGGGFGGSSIALLPSEKVEQAAEAIARAFAEAGFAEPEFAVALPGAGARREA